MPLMERGGAINIGESGSERLWAIRVPSCLGVRRAHVRQAQFTCWSKVSTSHAWGSFSASLLINSSPQKRLVPWLLAQSVEPPVIDIGGLAP